MKRPRSRPARYEASVLTMQLTGNRQREWITYDNGGFLVITVELHDLQLWARLCSTLERCADP